MVGLGVTRMGIVRRVMRGGVIRWRSVVLMRSRSTAAPSSPTATAVVVVVMTSSSAAGMITVAMIALASANAGMSRHVNRRLQMVSVPAGERRVFSRVLRDSTTRFVGPSVGPSVCPSHFTFFGSLRSLASVLLPK